MKRFITTLCLILSVVLFAVGCSCGGSEKNWKVGYAGGGVSSNGGFVVEVGPYVYFINGVATNTDNNTFGKPQKGSLVRMLKTDLANPQGATSAEVVVPKLFASTNYDAGVSIFGDYVYYGTPNTAKDKAGKVQNSQIIFAKTKLDGTGTKEIVKCDTLSQNYKFISVGTEVYLVTVTASSTEENSTSTIVVYNANSGAKLFEQENADSVVISQEMTLTDKTCYLFYTDMSLNEDEQEEKFGAIYAYKLGDSKASILIDGDKAVLGGTLGYSFKLIKYANGILYYNATNASSGEAGKLYYYNNIENSTILALDDKKSEDVAVKNNYIAKVQANFVRETQQLKDVKNALVSKAIVATSKFYSKNYIVYYDSNYGLISYNYESDGTALVSTALIDIESPTFKFINGDYAYFTDTNSMIYRIEINNTSATMERVTPIMTNTSWYLPEIVDVNGTEYILLNINGEPHQNYIYSFETDLNAKMAKENNLNPEATDFAEKVKECKDKYFEDINNKEEVAFKAVLNRRIGVVAGADKTLTNSYLSSNYASSASSSSSK